MKKRKITTISKLMEVNSASLRRHEDQEDPYELEGNTKLYESNHSLLSIRGEGLSHINSLS